MPVTEASVLALLDCQDLPGPARIASSNLACFCLATDKAAVLSFASQVDIDVPASVDARRRRPPADRAALRRSLDLPPNVPVIGSIGWLEPIEKYQLALRALAKVGKIALDERGPFLVLAGHSSERAGLEALAEELGAADQVKFLGWRNDPERLRRFFDSYTIPSLSEGISFSLLDQ